MRKRPLVGALALGCACLLANPVWAATLEPGQGELTVNQGQGFQPVNGRVDAKVGDSVMVAPGGSATLTYADGCSVPVEPGSVTTVAPISPCASGSYAQSNYNGFDWGGALMGVAAGAGIGVGIYYATQSPNNGTTSPNPASP